MRKIDNKTNKKSKDVKPFTVERWLKYMMIPTIVLLILTVFVLKGSLYSDSEAVIGYNEIGDIDYKVYLKENNYYSGEYLEKNMQYIANLIDKVKINFKYEIHSQEKMDYTYKYNINADLIITDPNDNNKVLYKKNSILVNDKEEKLTKSSFRIDEDLDIDYDEYNNYVNAFKKEYALNVKSKLVITMDINIVGKSDILKEDFVKSSKLVIAIPMSEQTISIGIDTSDINNSGVLEKNYVSLIKKPVALILGIIVGLLSLCLLYISLYTILSNRVKTDIYKSTVNRIINEYDRAIVTSKSIESINEDEYNVIEVTNIEELLDAHDSTGQPILYNETIENNVSVFVIVADDILYKLTIDRHELEENERERIRKKNEYIQQKIDNVNIFKKEK